MPEPLPVARPALGRIPLGELLLLIADSEHLPRVPNGRLPVLDGWQIDLGEHDLLHIQGHLDGAAERLNLPLLAVAPRLSAAWLVGAAWVELGAHATLTSELAVVATLLGAELWCDALRHDLLTPKSG
ncbi:hypothetical protein [Rubellimicrobium arenae]|uniref:hypothetical protein n=1 Tax=Rubellimicrobium arenae TaxID=2817372 RepID=UPI001B3067C4|nr:hypothetical protein [Rubellimicrobium arenae]